MADVEGAEIVGVVQAIVPGGEGLVRDGDGVVFVRGALPGERVRARVERRHKRVRHARVLEVLEASPERVRPDCPLHASSAPGERPACGGCDLLDFSPAAQRAAKSGIVRDALVRVGKLDAAVVDAAVAPLLAPAPGSQDGARRRARFVIVDGAPTFSARESHARVPVARCPALHPALEGALARMCAHGRVPDGAVRLACDARGRVSAAVDGADAARFLVDAGLVDGAVVEAPGHPRAPPPAAVDARFGDPGLVGEVTAGAFLAHSDAAVFTQATRFGGAAIRDAVVAGCGAVEDKRVLELFAGAGHLTLPLLAAGAVVDAVEGAPRAVRFLEDNVSAFSARARVRRAGIDAGLPCGDVDLLVADPPRTGIPGFDALLERARPGRLVLVSCDPATGARDLAAAVRRGYALESLVPIDAFPRTSHVEWVAALAER